MKILYIFRSLAVWGGIERILIDKMNYLSGLNEMDVYMITSDQGNHSIPYTLNSNVSFEDLGICFYRQYQYCLLKRVVIRRKMIKRYEGLLAERLSNIDPDIIVCTTADMISSIVKVKGSIPLVVESHSICIRTVNNGKNRIQRIINRYFYLNCLRKVDVLVALTEGDAYEWKKYHQRVVVIPNSVHLNNCLMSEVLSKKVIFVGRFDYQKRVSEAIRIWSVVRQKHPDWVLEIYGEGELKKEIEDRSKEVGGIIINHPTNLIFDRYREGAILISTSLFEPFGLVLPEAMSCGLPVVAYDCQYGPADIITNGVDGFLIKQDDVKSFVEKLSFLMSNPNVRKKMGEAGMISARRYESSQIMPLWLNLFQQLNHKNSKKSN